MHLCRGADASCPLPVLLSASRTKVQLSFTSPVDVYSLRLTFQGGFVGKSVQLGATNAASPKKFLPVHTWEPVDANHEQELTVPTSGAIGATNIKITFPDSTDFYGRITIYKLDVIGCVSEQASATTDASPSPSA